MADRFARIFYVDGEPDIQMVAKLALEMIRGVTLSVCRSDVKAWEQAAGFKPQLFLPEVMLPGLPRQSTLQLRTFRGKCHG
jgi:two-component system OmpR family response regulator